MARERHARSWFFHARRAGGSDARARFDAIRTLGNLAEHPGLRKAMLAEGSLSLAPHLDSLGMSNVDYPWLEIRQEYA